MGTNEHTNNPLEVAEPKEALTVYSERGLRSYQEDRYVADPLSIDLDRQLQVLAVMDGHGGSEVAELVAKEMIPTLRENFQESNSSILETLQKTVSALNALARNMRAGSTLSLVVIPDNEQKAYVAVLGDSLIVISDQNGDINVSPEHNARTNVAEREAAVKRGAIYDGAYLVDDESGYGLQMSRALGDRDLDGFLNRDAEVYTVNLGEKSFIIVATDGVFDPEHKDTEQETRRLAEMVAKGAGAEELVQDAIGRQTEDNATAIVWRAV